MATPRFTEEEITARAHKLADEQRPGWDAIMGSEQDLLSMTRLVERIGNASL